MYQELLPFDQLPPKVQKLFVYIILGYAAYRTNVDNLKYFTLLLLPELYIFRIRRATFVSMSSHTRSLSQSQGISIQILFDVLHWRTKLKYRIHANFQAFCSQIFCMDCCVSKSLNRFIKICAETDWARSYRIRSTPAKPSCTCRVVLYRKPWGFPGYINWENRVKSGLDQARHLVKNNTVLLISLVLSSVFVFTKDRVFGHNSDYKKSLVPN